MVVYRSEKKYAPQVVDGCENSHSLSSAHSSRTAGMLELAGSTELYAIDLITDHS